MRVSRHFTASREVAALENLAAGRTDHGDHGRPPVLQERQAPERGKIWEGWTRLTLMVDVHVLHDHLEPPADVRTQEP